MLGSLQFDGDIKLQDTSMKETIVSYKEKLAYILNETPFPLNLSAKDCGKCYGRNYQKFQMDQYLRYLKKYEILPSKKIKYLSTGEQIKQQLAFALSYDANLFIMDEPNSNLDVHFRDQFYQTLRELIADGDRKSVV